MAGYNYYRSQKGRRYTKEEKAERAQKARLTKIKNEFLATKHLYDYDRIALTAEAARLYGFSVYWSKCGNGHIGEFTLNGQCKTCRKVYSKQRDAKKRGSTTVQLSAEDRKKIAEIYHHAKVLTKETGIVHHVDHIKPLAAGGEHHPSNLRAIPAQENLSKGAKFNGSKHTYSKAERKVLSKKLESERKAQLERMKHDKFEAAMSDYNIKLKQYNELSFFKRLVTNRPIKPVQ